MWLMPSYGRPEALERLLEAPGGWPDRVFVLVNIDDPEMPRYQQVLDRLWLDRLWLERSKMPWRIMAVPEGSRFADAVRHAYGRRCYEPFYGIIDDDYWPVTPGWHEKMVAAAGPNCIAIANNMVNFPSVFTCRVMGGELARAIGTIAPGQMRHNYSDDTWGRFAQDFDLLRPLEDVIVEHRHHLWNKDVPKDATYERGSGKDFDVDRRHYQEWLNSDERRQQCARVAKLLGGVVTVTDFAKVHLGICVPMQNMTVDFAFHRSLMHTIELCRAKGIHVTLFEKAGGSHIGKAREGCLWNAMHAGCTHILQIDDDMGWDASLVSRLICADHDFACAVGVQKVDKLSLCCNFFADPQVFHPVTRFLKIRDVGGAFVMLKRAAVERMCEAYPELKYDTGDQPAEWGLYMDMIDRRTNPCGDRLSEDFAFCRRWLAIGGEIWADPHAALIHAGRKEFTGKPSDVFKPMVGPANAA